MAKHMLSTVDNPYNPFTHWDEWWAFDTDPARGYHTSGLLARIARNSDEMSESDQEWANESAIDEILHEDFRGMYIRVSPESKIIPTKLEL
ncbi:hypothetical protein PP914_gp247 [Arthrobacter phage Qui]|jgi:hypothetical protein|uniref:Uncharacterized protein n=1 Tax=Arthrobacter phage Qui TaxID=2603260 RepID=A0A5B8WKW2_9CAUD|nr:hypothetical protein PP914_gp247 [Arthrobacter phage Qui]QED11735.1 hypothetical protein SEA_QUI_247 [Arthrobacter phage Qui]QOC56567.1 hypothetical protein SEA_PAELLA_248 [Arthrobacter phage Paella]